jgi:hypothetical protein
MEGVGAYIDHRREWEGYIRELTDYMQFTMAEVDPIGERHTAPETVGSRS